ncbi:MAG: hypothetical protein ACI9ZF_000002 [Bradyrhizobium sp.]|jgi:hypothetical protein
MATTLDLTTSAGIAAANTALNLQMANDSYDGAVKAAALKKEAIAAGLDSMAEKMTTASMTRASQSADKLNQI